MKNQSKVVEINNITKVINKKTIVDDVTLSLEKGEILGLLGPNGAGKTTIIRMLVGLIKIDRGSIQIMGKDITLEYEQAINNVGCIVEAPDVYKHLSGYRNLKIFANMYESVNEDWIEELIEIVGLKDKIHKKVSTYSLGMKQRLGLAVAMLNKPKVLILDEPTNGLDPQGVHDIRNYLKKISREFETTIIVSSHLLSEMELMCDRVAIIEKGRLITINTVGSLNKVPKYIFEFKDEIIAKKALEILKEQGTSSEIVNNSIIITLEKSDIPKINEILTSQGFQIYSINEIKETLEEFYLNSIGG